LNFFELLFTETPNEPRAARPLTLFFVGSPVAMPFLVIVQAFPAFFRKPDSHHPSNFSLLL